MATANQRLARGAPGPQKPYVADVPLSLALLWRCDSLERRPPFRVSGCCKVLADGCVRRHHGRISRLFSLVCQSKRRSDAKLPAAARPMGHPSRPMSLCPRPCSSPIRAMGVTPSNLAETGSVAVLCVPYRLASLADLQLVSFPSFSVIVSPLARLFLRLVVLRGHPTTYRLSSPISKHASSLLSNFLFQSFLVAPQPQCRRHRL